MQTFKKILPKLSLCPEFVQRGVSLVLPRDFESLAGLFHIVFNRTVENFYRAFMLREESSHECGAKIALTRIADENLFKQCRKVAAQGLQA
jgi:hypothetical protein